MNRRALIVAAAVALMVSCLVGGARGPALYPTTYPPPTLNEVAQLTGYVAEVDGKDVSTYGKSFELLPGCHLIATPTEWGTFSNAGAVVLKTGRVVFALPMKPARQYVVAIRTDESSGVRSVAAVEATEKDLDGNTVNVFRPARDRKDIEACTEIGAPTKSPDKTSSAPVDIAPSDGGTID